jgi:tRNA (mo5U34)-methyltransferase
MMSENNPDSIETLRAEIMRLGPWHHDIEVAPGLRTGEPVPFGTYSDALGTPTIYPPALHIAEIVREVFPQGLAGRAILDCACNAGGYLFGAAGLGAGRSFGFDVREHWISQARFLAKHLPSDNIEFATCDLAALPTLALEPFDVTLFMGIFYHLPDPIAGLRIAADHTRELLIINTAIQPGKRDALVLNRESRTFVMSGVDGLAWLPTNDRVLRDILEWCGFPHARLRFHRRTKPHFDRMEILAARQESTFCHYDALRTASRRGRYLRWLRRLFGRT